MKAYICPLGIGTEIKIGEEGEMPWSEVCMHMRIAGKRMRFRVVPSRAWGAAVQLITPDGQEFSAPILTGEAGIYRDCVDHVVLPAARPGCRREPGGLRLIDRVRSSLACV